MSNFEGFQFILAFQEFTLTQTKCHFTQFEQLCLKRSLQILFDVNLKLALKLPFQRNHKNVRPHLGRCK